MRVVSGKLRGRPILAPVGKQTRPTTDRVRENLFNLLSNRVEFTGARVLDLFAGSGALGIEALSRGAEFSLFVEDAVKPRAAIRQNIEALGLYGCSQIFRRDATRLGPIGTMSPFNLAFADPPYGRQLGEKAARALVSGKWLTDNAMFILEEDRSVMPEKLEGFETIDIRNYGGTAVGLFEFLSENSI